MSQFLKYFLQQVNNDIKSFSKSFKSEIKNKKNGLMYSETLNKYNRQNSRSIIDPACFNQVKNSFQELENFIFVVKMNNLKDIQVFEKYFNQHEDLSQQAQINIINLKKCELNLLLKIHCLSFDVLCKHNLQISSQIKMDLLHLSFKYLEFLKTQFLKLLNNEANFNQLLISTSLSNIEKQKVNQNYSQFKKYLLQMMGKYYQILSQSLSNKGEKSKKEVLMISKFISLSFDIICSQAYSRKYLKENSLKNKNSSSSSWFFSSSLSNEQSTLKMKNSILKNDFKNIQQQKLTTSTSKSVNESNLKNQKQKNSKRGLFSNLTNLISLSPKNTNKKNLNKNIRKEIGQSDTSIEYEYFISKGQMKIIEFYVSNIVQYICENYPNETSILVELFLKKYLYSQTLSDHKIDHHKYTDLFFSNISILIFSLNIHNQMIHQNSQQNLIHQKFFKLSEQTINFFLTSNQTFIKSQNQESKHEQSIRSKQKVLEFVNFIVGLYEKVMINYHEIIEKQSVQPNVEVHETSKRASTQILIKQTENNQSEPSIIFNSINDNKFNDPCLTYLYQLNFEISILIANLIKTSNLQFNPENLHQMNVLLTFHQIYLNQLNFCNNSIRNNQFSLYLSSLSIIHHFLITQIKSSYAYFNTHIFSPNKQSSNCIQNQVNSTQFKGNLEEYKEFFNMYQLILIESMDELGDQLEGLILEYYQQNFKGKVINDIKKQNASIEFSMFVNVCKNISSYIAKFLIEIFKNNFNNNPSQATPLSIYHKRTNSTFKNSIKSSLKIIKCLQKFVFFYLNRLSVEIDELKKSSGEDFFRFLYGQTLQYLKVLYYYCIPKGSKVDYVNLKSCLIVSGIVETLEKMKRQNKKDQLNQYFDNLLNIILKIVQRIWHLINNQSNSDLFSENKQLIQKVNSLVLLKFQCMLIKNQNHLKIGNLIAHSLLENYTKIKQKFTEIMLNRPINKIQAKTGHLCIGQQLFMIDILYQKLKNNNSQDNQESIFDLKLLERLLIITEMYIKLQNEVSNLQVQAPQLSNLTNVTKKSKMIYSELIVSVFKLVIIEQVKISSKLIEIIENNINYLIFYDEKGQTEISFLQIFKLFVKMSQDQQQKLNIDLFSSQLSVFANMLIKYFNNLISGDIEIKLFKTQTLLSILSSKQFHFLIKSHASSFNLAFLKDFLLIKSKLIQQHYDMNKSNQLNKSLQSIQQNYEEQKDQQKQFAYFNHSNKIQNFLLSTKINVQIKSLIIELQTNLILEQKMLSFNNQKDKMFQDIQLQLKLSADLWKKSYEHKQDGIKWLYSARLNNILKSIIELIKNTSKCGLRQIFIKNIMTFANSCLIYLFDKKTIELLNQKNNLHHLNHMALSPHFSHSHHHLIGLQTPSFKLTSQNQRQILIKELKSDVFECDDDQQQDQDELTQNQIISELDINLEEVLGNENEFQHKQICNMKNESAQIQKLANQNSNILQNIQKLYSQLIIDRKFDNPQLSNNNFTLSIKDTLIIIFKSFGKKYQQYKNQIEIETKIHNDENGPNNLSIKKYFEVFSWIFRKIYKQINSQELIQNSNNSCSPSSNNILAQIELWVRDFQFNVLKIENEDEKDKYQNNQNSQLTSIQSDLTNINKNELTIVKPIIPIQLSQIHQQLEYLKNFNNKTQDYRKSIGIVKQYLSIIYTKLSQKTQVQRIQIENEQQQNIYANELIVILQKIYEILLNNAKQINEQMKRTFLNEIYCQIVELITLELVSKQMQKHVRSIVKQILLIKKQNRQGSPTQLQGEQLSFRFK